MKDRILYILLYAWVKFHAILPLRILYGLYSPLLYFIIYRAAGYRRRIVRRNMAASFPDKTAKELLRLERGFYRHFADYIIETLKMAHISLKEINSRAHFENPELIDRLMSEGHSCVIMLLGHYGNWEWCTAGGSFFEDARLYNVYRPLKNKAFDRLFIRLRTQFGSLGIEKRSTLRDVVKLKRDGKRSIAVFVADQTPSPANINYRTNFLNQDTPFLDGAERIARRLNIPVVFADIRKIARGRYSVEFKLIEKEPQSSPEFQITESYARMLENTIMRDPANWLWTHKRWKYSRNKNI